MGCICSTRAERKKKRRRGHVIQVEPIGDGSQRVMSKTDFRVFQVQNTESANEEVMTDELPKSEGDKVLGETYENSGMDYRLTGVAARGVAFEVYCEENKAVVAPPPRLLQLKVKSIDKNEPSVDDIKERLLKAERRRKQLEDERVFRVRKMIKTESPETVNAFILERKKLEAAQTKQMEDAVSSRQQRLCRLRDRLREKDIHAKAVRRNKKVNLDDLGEAPKDVKMYSFHTSHN